MTTPSTETPVTAQPVENSPAVKQPVENSAASKQPKVQKLTDMRFILLDTETTGIDPTRDHVIEIAARGWSLNKRKKFPRTYSMLLNPGEGVKIPPNTSAVHHITDADVVDMPTLADEEGAIKGFVKGFPIVAYNAEFDRGMLPFLKDQEWLDVYRMAMHLWHIGEENDDGFPLTSFKQQELRYWLQLGKIEGDAHRAAADIMVTGLIFQKAAQKYLDMGHPNEYPAFVEWVNSPILHQTIPFGYKSVVGKRPEDLTDQQLKNVFDKDSDMYASYERFNVLDFLRAEHLRRTFRRHNDQVPPEATRKSFAPGQR